MINFNNYIVNLDILMNNVKNIRKVIDENKKICAVVKANAYGLGLHTICKALKGYVDFFGCASLKEALDIRTFDKISKILVLGVVEIKDIDLCIENDISISLGTLEQIQQLNQLLNKKINIHLQVNTGLNRFGFNKINEFKKSLEIINNNEYLNLEGVYSHFATKKNDIEFMNKQYLRFLQFKKYVKSDNVIFHIANSYATLHSSKFHFDMVRTGLLMYGYTENTIENKPVLSINSKIINILKVKKGDTIGYDRTYKVNKSMLVGVVPIGYADGLSRNLSNKFEVVINDKKYPNIGLICMDVFMVKIDNNVKIGDTVTILGKDKTLKLTPKEYSDILKTSPYEVLCNFNYKRMNYIINKNT